MATGTDLAGFLTDDDINLQQKLSDWISNLKDSDPVVINVKYAPVGGRSYEKVNSKPIVMDPPDFRGVSNLIERIQALIINVFGYAPEGRFRVQGYIKGQSRAPGFDFQRTLSPSADGIADPDKAMLKWMLSREMARNDLMVAEMRQMFIGLMQGHASMSQALQGAATIRTASSASADLGSGFMALFGLGTLVIAAPIIKKELGLAPDASLEDVVLKIRALGSHVALGEVHTPDGDRVKVPSSARSQLAAPADQADAPPASEDDDDIAALITKMKTDPFWRDKLLDAASEDGELSAALKPKLIAMATGS